MIIGQTVFAEHQADGAWTLYMQQGNEAQVLAKGPFSARMGSPPSAFGGHAAQNPKLGCLTV